MSAGSPPPPRLSTAQNTPATRRSTSVGVMTACTWGASPSRSTTYTRWMCLSTNCRRKEGAQEWRTAGLACRQRGWCAAELACGSGADSWAGEPHGGCHACRCAPADLPTPHTHLSQQLCQRGLRRDGEQLDVPPGGAPRAASRGEEWVAGGGGGGGGVADVRGAVFQGQELGRRQRQRAQLLSGDGPDRAGWGCWKVGRV